MTKAKAEAIIGREVKVKKDAADRWSASFRVGPNAEGEITVWDRTQSEALHDLVETNLRLNRELVMARDHYRCINCRAFGAMHCDHKVARSHGRDDRIENLVTLCRECHGIRHTIPGFHLVKE